MPARRPKPTAAGKARGTVAAKTHATAMRRPAPASVVRVTEATGSSPRGWEVAVAAAVKASEIRDVVGVEVTRFWGEWGGRRIRRYHVTVKVAYRQALKAPGR